MLSLLAPGSYITSSIPNGKYAGMHGTSMAAPHVAGAFALLRERTTGASVKTVLDAIGASHGGGQWKSMVMVDDRIADALVQHALSSGEAAKRPAAAASAAGAAAS
jgi:subtilisin family serine protease